jgi:hypothetical protein
MRSFGKRYGSAGLLKQGRCQPPEALKTAPFASILKLESKIRGRDGKDFPYRPGRNFERYPMENASKALRLLSNFGII